MTRKQVPGSPCFADARLSAEGNLKKTTTTVERDPWGRADARLSTEGKKNKTVGCDPVVQRKENAVYTRYVYN